MQLCSRLSGIAHSQIKEARRRQRRRRFALAAAAIAAAGVGAGAYFGAARNGGGSSSSASSRPAASARTLTIHLAGFGAPIATAIDRGPCPQGRTLIAVRSTAGSHVGSVLGCVLTIRKWDVANCGVARISQTAIETYRLRGGTIVTRERQTIRFARDQRHTVAVFRGRVVGGTGRYAHVRGTVTGGGSGLDGKADWAANIRLR